MRVIAGDLRSRLLVAPRGLSTRPTSDRLRETLFNVLAPRLPGARFLDLFAGSGANGIEALSRGAAHATFVEQAPPALLALRANLSTLALLPRSTVAPRPVAPWLRANDAATSYTLLFLDPPYDDPEAYTTTLTLLAGEARPLLAPGALLIAEHRRPHPNTPPLLAENYGPLTRTRLLTQGDAALSFYALA